MSFEWPLVLLGLLLVPLAALLHLHAQRRRVRYAARFTNLEVLAAVVGRTVGLAPPPPRRRRARSRWRRSSSPSPAR